ncbi:TPA: YiiG family protein [Stenotrophomonas maltophilia]|nr:YiiG family protein [Stenotrophomonas maltophilia]HDS1027498.1 YiiG family protein [Stenotrophomonas maltophilia]HDS1031614.1 YiiG family protein [Stenotrophomonas maltophilia]HDS1036348.1 YiiG family protein [Stenotrophomonas maltophilia]
MDTMLRIAVLGLPVALALVLVACRGRPAGADAPGMAAGQKLEHYVGCFNALDTRILSGLRPYMYWMDDPSAGPTGLEGAPVGPADISPRELKACERSFAAGMAAQPAMPALDASAKTYLAALRKLQPLAHEASNYYASGAYRRDAFARGKALHGPLSDALTDFLLVSMHFSEALDAEVEHATRARLGGMEASEGRTREYYQIALMLEARLLLDDITEEEDFNVDVASQRVAAFAALVDEARIKVPSLKQGGQGWEVIGAPAAAYLGEARVRLELMTARAQLSGEQQALLDAATVGKGSADAVQQAYDALQAVVPQ